MLGLLIHGALHLTRSANIARGETAAQRKVLQSMRTAIRECRSTPEVLVRRHNSRRFGSVASRRRTKKNHPVAGPPGVVLYLAEDDFDYHYRDFGDQDNDLSE